MSKQHRLSCIQCGNDTAAEVIGTVTDTHWYYGDEEDPDSAMSQSFYYEVVRCITCKVLQIFEYDEDHEGGLDSAELLYPLKRSIPQGVPTAIAREFWEAQKVEKISSTAYAVLIGRVLERLFKDKGATGERLYDQIKDLSDRGIIPDTLCEMGHALRFLRNKGAHVSDYEIEDNEVEAMRDFVITMLEYVYVAPAKLAALKETIERKKKGLSQKDIDP
jgi:hypothetical protein